MPSKQLSKQQSSPGKLGSGSGHSSKAAETVGDNDTQAGGRTVGSRLQHPTRGEGTVVQILANDPRGKPYKVKFDNGEVHQYNDG